MCKCGICLWVYKHMTRGSVCLHGGKKRKSDFTIQGKHGHGHRWPWSTQCFLLTCDHEFRKASVSSAAQPQFQWSFLALPTQPCLLAQRNFHCHFWTTFPWSKLELPLCCIQAEVCMGKPAEQHGLEDLGPAAREAHKKTTKTQNRPNLPRPTHTHTHNAYNKRHREPWAKCRHFGLQRLDPMDWYHCQLKKSYEKLSKKANIEPTVINPMNLPQCKISKQTKTNQVRCIYKRHSPSFVNVRFLVVSHSIHSDLVSFDLYTNTLNSVSSSRSYKFVRQAEDGSVGKCLLHKHKEHLSPQNPCKCKQVWWPKCNPSIGRYRQGPQSKLAS